MMFRFARDLALAQRAGIRSRVIQAFLNNQIICSSLHTLNRIDISMIDVRIETSKYDSFNRIIFSKKIDRFSDCYTSCFFDGIAIDSATDGGESNRFNLMRDCQIKARSVAGGKQLCLAARPPVPHGAYGV